MSVRFQAAVETTLEREGILSEDSRDPGGTTKWGISLRWLKSIGTILGDIDKDGDVDADDVRALTRPQAIELYWRKFWRLEYDGFPADVGEKVFDTAVNMGMRPAVKLLQVALFEVNTHVPLKLDGILGPKTVAATMTTDPAPLLREFRAAQSYRYANIAIQNISLRYALRGWMRRAAA